MTSAKRKYTNADEVYKRLEAYFTEHPVGLGERIMPERMLADLLKVNRTTLRSAMHRMVRDGMLERHVGRGTFFKASPASISENYRPFHLDCNRGELLELRLLIEPQIAALAAAHLTPEQAQTLREYLDGLADMSAEHQLESELTLQRLLAVCLQNRLLTQMTQMIHEMERKCEPATQEARVSLPDLMPLVEWREHQRTIIHAVLKRDGVSAFQAVEAKLSACFKALSDHGGSCS